MDYRKKWEIANTFPDYLFQIETLFDQGKTTGFEQSEARIKFTGLNVHRMKRVFKVYEPSLRAIEAFAEHLYGAKVLVIAEGWCGDAAQIVPAMAKLTEASGIEFRIITRDENEDLMQMHLTNGTRSVPKFIFLDENWHVIDTWGARPEALQEMVDRVKNDPTSPIEGDDLKKEIQIWYNNDKQRHLEREWIELAESVLI